MYGLYPYSLKPTPSVVQGDGHLGSSVLGVLGDVWSAACDGGIAGKGC